MDVIGTCQHHRICQKPAKGVVVCVWDPEEKALLMGKERFGRYKNKWNVCAGSVEAEDHGCLIEAACRELREEFKLVVTRDSWPLYLRRCFWLASTAVFVIRPPHPINIQVLNTRNKEVLMDHNAPPTHQEMEQIRWICVASGVEESLPMSALARYILKRHLMKSPKTTVPMLATPYDGPSIANPFLD